MNKTNISAVVLADTSGNIDEGMKVTAKNIIDSIDGLGVDTHVLNPLEASSLEFWRQLRSISPDVVHYIPGPSTKSVILGRMCSVITGAPLVMSAPLPRLGPIGDVLIRRIGPQLVFVQSEQSLTEFQQFGIPTEFVPTGVDTDRFQPVDDPNQLDKLYEKYDLAKDKKIVLHVGHIKRGRNLEWLIGVQKTENTQVVIIGSTTTEPEQGIHTELQNSGCDVRRQYYDQIEELYAIANVYAFPTRSQANSIQCPASVLEALASGTPVVSTRFGALPYLFKEQDGKGIEFVENKTEFINSVQDTKDMEEVSPRKFVEAYDWRDIGKQILAGYHEVRKSD